MQPLQKRRYRRCHGAPLGHRTLGDAERPGGWAQILRLRGPMGTSQAKATAEKPSFPLEPCTGQTLPIARQPSRHGRSTWCSPMCSSAPHPIIIPHRVKNRLKTKIHTPGRNHQAPWVYFNKNPPPRAGRPASQIHYPGQITPGDITYGMQSIAFCLNECIPMRSTLVFHRV